MMRFALDPGIGNRDPGAVKTPDRSGRRQVESTIGPVDLDLGNGDRLRSVGADVELDHARAQARAFHHDLFDRRRGGTDPVERARAQHIGDDRGQNQKRKRQPDETDHHTTSKWLIQPSSANSV
jgi:hypothetical protein